MHNRLHTLLIIAKNHISTASVATMTYKSAVDKWSKIEILGHLIDSGLYNLIRFNEIQFKDQPYQIFSYQQNQLVAVNDYQNADSAKLLELWTAINLRILKIIEKQTEANQAYPLLLED